jgi:hypothetical protein
MAVTISINDSGSRGIDCLGRFEDVFPTQPVFTPIDGAFDDQIDFPIEDDFEFVAHLDGFGESAFGIGGKIEQHVDVAVGAEVVAKDGAKQGKLRNLPPIAKRCNFFCWEFDREFTHVKFPPGF